LAGKSDNDASPEETPAPAPTGGGTTTAAKEEKWDNGDEQERLKDEAVARLRVIVAAREAQIADTLRLCQAKEVARAWVRFWVVFFCLSSSPVVLVFMYFLSCDFVSQP
jgi:hypothetical protein